MCTKKSDSEDSIFLGNTNYSGAIKWTQEWKCTFMKKIFFCSFTGNQQILGTRPVLIGILVDIGFIMENEWRKKNSETCFFRGYAHWCQKII